jgi:phage terminase small subunit
MGTRNAGRRRKSTTLHLLAGTYRPDRHADRHTPDPPHGRPDKPPTLMGEASKEWDRMVARLEIMQTLTKVDDAALYQYCQLFAETEGLTPESKRLLSLSRTLRRQLKTVQGAAVVELAGEIIKVEQLRARTLQQLRSGHMAIRHYLIEFGMTPSARTRVKALGARSGEPTPQDRLRAKFFGSGHASA